MKVSWIVLSACCFSIAACAPAQDKTNTDTEFRRKFREAVEEGEKEDLVALIEQGVGANVKDDGFSPVVTAVRNGHLEILQILLEHGADANAEDNSGWSALNFRISKLLSGNQDDFDSDEEERSIDWNPRVTEDEYVKLLLSKGATFDRNNKFYSRLFDQAMSTGDEDLVNLFLSNIGDINSEKRILCSPAAKGNVIMVNLLISKGATINTDPSYGWTPLHSAAARNQAETAKLLISKGADVNTAVSANKQTPLLVAAIYGHVDVADVLLSNGANVNSTNQYGDTPISIAVGKDDVDMIRLLVEKGAVLPESAAQYKDI